MSHFSQKPAVTSTKKPATAAAPAAQPRRQPKEVLAGQPYAEQVAALRPAPEAGAPEAASAPAASAPAASASAASAAATTAATAEAGFAEPMADAEAPEMETWRSTGNLIGAPPVRDPMAPPNLGVVEDQAVYQQRLSVAKGKLEEQKARAAGMLDAEGNVTDYRYWFAKVYTHVTDNEIMFAESNSFYYPSYVMASVAYFEQLYADNTAAMDRGDTVEEHWRIAFEKAAQEQKDMAEWRALIKKAKIDPTGTASALIELGSIGPMVEGIVSSLVASMQAHIRFDLPRAEAWVFSTYYAGMDGANMADFRDDFMAMSGVFDDAGVKMNDEIAERVGLPIDLTPRVLQDSVMNFIYDADMASERADTWQRAEDLVNEGLGDGAEHVGGSVAGENIGDAASQLQQLSNTALRPSMDSSATDLTDDISRAKLDGLNEGELAKISTTQRVRLTLSMLRGACTNADERQIIRLLNSAGGALPTMVNGVNGWELLRKMNGAEYYEVRQILRTGFYAKTGQQEAIRLVQQCIDGYTGEWEEEMIADIFEERGDREQLLAKVGAIYGGEKSDDRANGLAELHWQLDGGDQRRIDKLFPAHPASAGGGE